MNIKMKNVLRLLGCLFIAVLAGCSDNEHLPEPIPEPGNHNSHFVPLDDAIRKAERSFSDFFGATRAGRTVKNVEFLNTITRADGSDINGQFYIVNYENDGGFAVLSSDDRLEPVYALSDEGSLHLSDTIENKGLSWYMNRYLSAAAINPVDTGKHDFEGPSPELFRIIRAPRSSFLQKFHQSAPYNTYCLTTTGETSVVGCVPLAVGTMMGCNKWPQSYGSDSFNWTAMMADSRHDGWARLFRICGNKENTEAEYLAEETLAEPKYIARTINNMGYINAKEVYFNADLLESQFNSTQGPLICSGKYNINRFQWEGHSWILDGYQIGETTYPDGKTFYKHYLHCVWGWGGKSNGYYLYQGETLGHIVTGRDPGFTDSSLPFTGLSICYGYQKDI